MSQNEGQYSEAARAKATLEALSSEKHESLTAVEKDDSNLAAFPGYPYKMRAIGINVIVNIDIFRSGYECSACKGKGGREIAHVEFGKGLVKEWIVCEVCNGKETLLHLPETAKTLPCTGVILSMGPQAEVARPDLKLYMRVLFGPFSGRFIPTKAGVLLKIMDIKEISAEVIGGEDLASFDFILVDKDME